MPSHVRKEVFLYPVNHQSVQFLEVLFHCNFNVFPILITDKNWAPKKRFLETLETCQPSSDARRKTYKGKWYVAKWSIYV